MKLHFVYRSVPGDSKKERRPDYFSKILGLKSFLNSVSQINRVMIGDLIFLNDGNPDREILRLMNSVKSEIINLNRVGNSKSLRHSYSFLSSRKWDDADLVYFSEDDYIYKESAFTELLNAYEDIFQADYFTLYDHPDRYTRKDDVYGGKSRIFLSRSMHWRTVESTCQTYGVKVGVMKKDLWVHKIGTIGNTPQGREMFRAAQGIGKYVFKIPKRNLISPLPSLCTHAEKKFLSELVDWEKEIKKVV